jgi:hypothetical protein
MLKRKSYYFQENKWTNISNQWDCKKIIVHVKLSGPIKIPSFGVHEIA